MQGFERCLEGSYPSVHENLASLGRPRIILSYRSTFWRWCTPESSREWQSSDQEQLSYLWDEYKYRHGLCWEAVYKVIAAVIFLAGLPYVNPELNQRPWVVCDGPHLYGCHVRGV
jgi:hypothetical protein